MSESWTPPEPSQASKRKSRNKGRIRGLNIRKGNLPILTQIAIIVAAIVLAALVVLVITTELNQPTHTPAQGEDGPN